MEKQKLSCREKLYLGCYCVAYFFYFILISIFDFLAGIIKSVHVKKSGRYLQVPVTFFKHPSIKEEVILISTIHIAEQEFYMNIERIVAEYHEYAVLYEGMKLITKEELFSLSDDERLVYRKICDLRKQQSLVAEITSQEFQAAAFKIRESWINSDVSIGELARLYSKNGVRVTMKNDSFHQFLSLADRQLGRGFSKRIIRMFMSRLTGIKLFEKYIAFLFRNWQKKNLIMIDYRNRVAFDGISNCIASGKSVISIWGSGHTPGIEKVIKASGFEVVKRVWIDSFKVK